MKNSREWAAVVVNDNQARTRDDDGEDDDVNFGNMMKQAQKMQARMAEMQEKLKEETVDASAGGGVVRVVLSGDVRVLEIHIDPSAVDPDDVELLEDMITAAMNEAIRAAQELSATRMAGITGGMNIPGMM